MSSVRNPAEKKRLAYERDHYNRGGENSKAWRKSKPLKKAKARRAFRRTANELMRICATAEGTSVTAGRKKAGLRQERVSDWGVIGLRDFVKSRQARRKATVGAKKARRARCAAPPVSPK